MPSPPLPPPPSQHLPFIHGDLTGNVLFAAGRAPAVIDFSPYWRPPVFAEAIVVADGLLWGAGPRGRARQGEPARYARAADVVVRKLAAF